MKYHSAQQTTSTGAALGVRRDGAVIGGGGERPASAHASSSQSISAADWRFRHLTNYAINKDNPKFDFNTDKNVCGIGNKRTLKWFYDEYLPSQNINVRLLKKKINKVIIKTFCSA